MENLGLGIVVLGKGRFFIFYFIMSFGSLSTWLELKKKTHRNLSLHCDYIIIWIMDNAVYVNLLRNLCYV